MYKIKRFSKYPSTKDRLKAALTSALMGGSVAAIAGGIIGAGIGLLSAFADPLQSFRQLLKSMLKNTLRGAGIGATSLGGLTSVIMAMSAWHSTSKKAIDETERRDKEVKERNKRLRSTIKSWADIKRAYGYEVPKDFIKFYDLQSTPEFECPVFSYIEEPWQLAAGIEVAKMAAEKYAFKKIEWECVVLVGNGVGDDESSNFYYDFDEKMWHDYWDAKSPKLKDMILHCYDEEEKYDGLSENSKRTKDLIKKNL